MALVNIESWSLNSMRKNFPERHTEEAGVVLTRSNPLSIYIVACSLVT
jgi:hypothetical protein